MPTIDSNGVWIRFEQYGEPAAPTVLLVHGFASSADDNWVQTGWVRALTKAGRRVVTVDCRGHGKSDKPHDPAAYGHDRMAADLEEVLRYANARTVDVFGYSMGSFLTLHLLERKPAPRALGDPRRCRRGHAEAARRDARRSPRRSTAQATRAASATPLRARSACSPRAAATTCSRSPRCSAPRARSRISRRSPSSRCPILVLTGAKDTLVGDPVKLAAALPGARAEIVPDADHLSAVTHPRMKEIALAFLAQVDAAATR